MNYVPYVLAKGLNRSTLDIALDLMFVATNIRFPADKIIFGKPRVVDMRPDLVEDPNSYVPLKWIDPKFDYRFNTPANDGILYYRLPFSLIEPRENITFTEPNTFAFSTHSILDKINTKLGVQFTVSDIVNIKYEGETNFITIIPHEDSLVWMGDSIELWFDGKEEDISGRVTEDNDIRVTEDDLVRATEDQ